MTQEKEFKPVPVKAAIAIEDLEKIDIRIGTILTVEDLPGSRKLVKLIVSFGDHRRVILAGMRNERENSKEIEGKQALFVVNLMPRQILGENSEGMVFDIGYADGLKPVLAIPEGRVPDGARAG